MHSASTCRCADEFSSGVGTHDLTCSRTLPGKMAASAESKMKSTKLLGATGGGRAASNISDAPRLGRIGLGSKSRSGSSVASPSPSPSPSPENISSDSELDLKPNVFSSRDPDPASSPSTADTSCAKKAKGRLPVPATADGWIGAEISNATGVNPGCCHAPGWRSDPGGGRGVEGRDVGTPAVVVVVVAGSSGDAQRRLALAERFLAATRLMAVLTRRTCLPRSHVASLRVTPMRESAKALKPWGFLQ